MNNFTKYLWKKLYDVLRYIIRRVHTKCIIISLSQLEECFDSLAFIHKISIYTTVKMNNKHNKFCIWFFTLKSATAERERREGLLVHFYYRSIIHTSNVNLSIIPHLFVIIIIFFNNNLWTGPYLGEATVQCCP